MSVCSSTATDEEAEALTTCLRLTIQDDSYPVAPRLGPLKNVLFKLDPMPQQRPTLRRHLPVRIRRAKKERVGMMLRPHQAEPAPSACTFLCTNARSRRKFRHLHRACQPIKEVLAKLQNLQKAVKPLSSTACEVAGAAIARSVRKRGHDPFDRRFFADLAIPALGFETFLGRETLERLHHPIDRSGWRACSSRARRRRACVFVARTPTAAIRSKAIPGPWRDYSLRGLDPRVHRSPDQFVDVQRPRCSCGPGGGPDLPRRAELLRYLDGLVQSDAMLRTLIDGLERRHPDATFLGFYGDHLPSLPRSFARLGFDDWRSDYAIWSSAGARRAPAGPGGARVRPRACRSCAGASDARRRCR